MSLEKLRRVKFYRIVIAALAFCSAISTQAVTSAEQSVLMQNETSVQESEQQAVIARDCTEKNTQMIAKPQQQKATPLARALAQSSNELSQNTPYRDKTLTLEISELTDNSGLVYLGGKVSTAELSGYLEQLKSQLGAEQYAIYRSHQAARDQQSFHVTLINPYEYQALNKTALKLPRQFRVILHGLGRVETDDKSSYFVVASSSDGQFIRQNLLLNNKDFHVTLGFYPDDIYGVSKGRDTLIQSQQQ
jgi:hypothetical protein